MRKKQRYKQQRNILYLIYSFLDNESLFHGVCHNYPRVEVAAWHGKRYTITAGDSNELSNRRIVPKDRKLAAL